MCHRILIAIALLATAGWAEENWTPVDPRAEAIDEYVRERDTIVDTRQQFAPPGFHAMFWGEDPDRFIIQVGAWYGKLNGPIKFENNTVLDVSDALGLDEREVIPFVRAGLRLGFLEIIAEWWKFDTTGQAIVDEQFEIDDVVFEIGDVIVSDLSLDTFRLALGFTVWRRDAITITLLAGVSFIDTKGSVRAVNVNKTARWNETIPLPAIGLSLKGYIRYPFIYEVEANWIGYSEAAFGIYALDLRAAVGVEFNDWVGGRIGYRFFRLEGEIEDVGLELELAGFYLEFYATF